MNVESRLDKQIKRKMIYTRGKVNNIRLVLLPLHIGRSRCLAAQSCTSSDTEVSRGTVTQMSNKILYQ